MITLIYPYRGRDIQRVKKSLDSLVKQSAKEFKVIFVDFGTEASLAKKIKALVNNYTFTKYIYTYECNKPWNKSRAINIALNKIETPFTFIADIDMIFAPLFVETLIRLKSDNKAYYFKVGFLSKAASKITKPFNEYQIKFTSNEGATGLTLFPTLALKAIGGFDEFYQYWGAEDSDAHIRIQNANIPVEFYDKQVLILHQWHPIYRSGTENKLTQELRISNIVRLNHEHLNFNKINGVTKVNSQIGRVVSKEEYQQLKQPTRIIKKTSNKSEIDYILKELKSVSNEVISYNIKVYRPSIKDKLKTILRKQERIAHYTLKEVNDILLKEILIHYNEYNYSFVVNADLKSIIFTIAL